MSSYIDVVVDTDPQDIMDDFVTFMQTVVPGWTPAVGNLDVWLMQAIATTASDSRDVASAVPKSIFRWYGANLLNFPPVDATAASVNSTWTVQDNAGYTIPAGTQVSIALTGDQLFAFETQVDVIIPPGSTTASGVVLIAVDVGADSSGLGGVGVAAQLIDPLSFVTTIILASATVGGIDAEDDDTYLNRLAAELQLLAPRPIIASDFAVFAKQIPGVKRAVAIDGYNPFHNLLTANQADAETDATGWSSLTNATPASSGAQAANGAKSVSMTAIAAADEAVLSPAGAGTTGIPCVQGDVITGVVSIRANTTVRSCKAQLLFYNAAGALVGSAISGTAANDSNSAWTVYTVTGTAPATAVFVKVAGYATAAAIGEVHYVDKASIRRGLGTDWVQGGTGETSQPRTVTVAAIDANGTPLDTTHKNAIIADLTARREVNFLIYVVDPNVSIIDITYQVKALAGYDLVALVTAINSALAQYLSPAGWGTTSGDPTAWTNQTMIRYLELAQVINQVPGVDYITTTGGNMDLQLGFHGGSLARVDLSLPGVAPLPTTVGGTLTGTAV